eukprot:m.245018 g.245018  ORF g.245018 m.245018 type:complete len:866 (-) comp26633_c7_seq3:191-2788(-)
MGDHGAPSTSARFAAHYFGTIPNCVIYIDDLLIRTHTFDEHLDTIRAVLVRMREIQFYASSVKCVFGCKQLDFLGFNIGSGRLQMPDQKVKDFAAFKPPADRTQLRRFLGATNYFAKLIKNYATLAAPLNDLLSPGVPYQLSSSALESFNSLKLALTRNPVLSAINFQLPFVLETDASTVAVGACLLQQHPDGLHPVAYHSRKLNHAQCNYPVHDLELLSIVSALRRFRPFVFGSCIEIITDHKPLIYLLTQASLSTRQHRWMAELSQYDYTIKYRKGKNNPLADCLSRDAVLSEREDDDGAPKGAVPSDQDDEGAHRPQADDTVPATAPADDDETQGRADDALGAFAYRLASTTLSQTDLEAFVDGYKQDPFFSRVYDRAQEPQYRMQYRTDDDGLLFLRESGRLCVPAAPGLRRRILQSHHDAPASGHCGVTKMLARLANMYFWPKMTMDVKSFVKGCDVCQRSKVNRTARHGLLHPIDVPHDFGHWTCDFVFGLPESASEFSPTEKYTGILVAVDRLTKFTRLMPCRETCSAREAAHLFFKYIGSTFGYPTSIISDRDPRFTSHFYTTLSALFGCALRFSSHSHPETDGQTERANQTMEVMLRCSVNHRHDDWVDMLPAVEFAINSTQAAATKSTPFELVFGFLPPTPDALLHPVDTAMPAVNDFAERRRLTLTAARDAQVVAKQLMADYTNRHRTPVKYKPGDEVVVSRKLLKPDNVVTGDKLSARYYGPFEVEKEIVPGASYRLRLPPTMRTHPVFHVSGLKLYHKDTWQRQPSPPPPIVTDNGPAHIVEAIRRHKITKGAPRYLVKWRGYNEDDNTWEPLDSFKHSSGTVNPILFNYCQRFPSLRHRLGKLQPTTISDV